jgi:hypothetical protein
MPSRSSRVRSRSAKGPRCTGRALVIKLDIVKLQLVNAGNQIYPAGVDINDVDLFRTRFLGARLQRPLRATAGDAPAPPGRYRPSARVGVGARTPSGPDYPQCRWCHHPTWGPCERHASKAARWPGASGPTLGPKCRLTPRVYRSGPTPISKFRLARDVGAGPQRLAENT